MEIKLEEIIKNDLVSQMYHVKSVEWLRYYYVNKANNLYDVVQHQDELVCFIEDVIKNPNYILNYECYTAGEHIQKLLKELNQVEGAYHLSNCLTHTLETVNDKRLSDDFIRKTKSEERVDHQDYRDNVKLLRVRLQQVKELIKETLEISEADKTINKINELV